MGCLLLHQIPLPCAASCEQVFETLLEMSDERYQELRQGLMKARRGTHRVELLDPSCE